jgi:hypothetical protein
MDAESINAMAREIARLRAERDEARRLAEEYRRVWEACSAAVDLTPNPDPLPWKR